MGKSPKIFTNRSGQAGGVTPPPPSGQPDRFSQFFFDDFPYYLTQENVEASRPNCLLWTEPGHKPFIQRPSYLYEPPSSWLCINHQPWLQFSPQPNLIMQPLSQIESREILHLRDLKLKDTFKGHIFHLFWVMSCLTPRSQTKNCNQSFYSLYRGDHNREYVTFYRGLNLGRKSCGKLTRV